MKFPFTIEQFLDVFRNYNQSVFPMQIVLNLLAALAVLLSTKKTVSSNRLINLILSFFWLWMGIVYHVMYFAEINKAAYFFGAIFVLQGLLFFYYGVITNKLAYRYYLDKSKLTGAILIIFALIFYPLLGYLSGRVYPSSPTFGLPCPTTIFTFGILLWHDKKLPIIILIIPFIWSMIGFLAAIKLGIREDTGLLVAGLLTLGMVLFNNRKIQLSSN